LVLRCFQKKPVTDNERVRMIILDGDRNGDFVLFNHDNHLEFLGGNESCVYCHHMNKPLDLYAPCFECHRDMYLSSNIFDHQYHVQKTGENKSCSKCHQKKNIPKSRESALDCVKCHENMINRDSFMPVPEKGKIDIAPPYKDALHKLCFKCHGPEKNYIDCNYCHGGEPEDLIGLMPRGFGNGVIP